MENNQVKKSSVHFSNPATTAIIYCSYSIATSEDSTEGEVKGGDDSQGNYFIYLSFFNSLK